MEGHVDPREGDGGNTTLKGDMTALTRLLLLGRLEAVVDDFLEYFLHLLDRERVGRLKGKSK